MSAQNLCSNCSRDVPPNVRFCPHCGQRTEPSPGFCARCGARVWPGESFCANCGQSVIRGPEPDTDRGLYAPVRLTVTYEYVESLSPGQLVTIRLLLFVKWLFAIPLYLFGTLYGIVSIIVVFIAFWAILFTGRFPVGLFAFVRGFVQYEYRILAYFPLLLTNHWTPNDLHPVSVEIDYPESNSRLVLVFLKLPSFLLDVVGNLASVSLLILFVVSVPAWFVILVTGRYPESWFRAILPLLEWNCRVSVWQYLMRDEVSLFGTTKPVKVLVVIGLVVSLLVSLQNCSVAL